MASKKIKSKREDHNKHEEDNYLYPALMNTKEGTRYGYITEKGGWVIEPNFIMAYDFNEYRLAIINLNGKFGVINKKCEYIASTIYDSIEQYKEGRAIYTKNGQMGVLDEHGEEIDINKYNFINSYSENRAVVSIVDENNVYKYGYINRDGKEVITPKFINANDFKDEVALVKIEDKKYALIDLSGNIINVYNYYFVSLYGDGVMVFSNSFDSLYGYINKAGEVIIKEQYSIAEQFENGVAVVSIDSNYNGPFALINIKGQYIYEPIYSSVKYIGENRVALGMKIGENDFVNRSIYAIGDVQGNILSGFKYMNVGEYKNGLAYASSNTHTFFIDKNGKLDNRLPIVKGSGSLVIKNRLIYADIDYSPYYITRSGRIIYEPNSVIQLNSNYCIIKAKYKPNINYLIYYPEVKGMKNKRTEKGVNIKLKELSYYVPQGEESESKVLDISTNDILDYNYYGNFNILFFNNNILTLELTGYYYPLGAAHGLPNRKTPTIDLVTGKFYSMSDLFMGGVYWVGELNKIIYKMIETDSQYGEVFKDDFKGISMNQDFYVDNDKLYIYYPPYEIGPYSAGYITFKIPFSEIEGMINKRGYFYKGIIS